MTAAASSPYPRPQLSENFVVIAGPCVIEGQDGAINWQAARFLTEAVKRFNVDFYFKSSFDKANRTSNSSYRGPGRARGLEILKAIKQELGVKILTDIHLPEEAAEAAQVADMLQIPAFLCRQSDLLIAAGETGKAVNIKKGQFLSPAETKFCADKVRETGNNQIYITERGTTFGYNNLVVDMRSVPIIQSEGLPIIFDATHSVQAPGGLNGKSGGKRDFAPSLARAAVASGCNGLFFETHPKPDEAMSDGPNQIFLDWVEPLLEEAMTIRETLSRLQSPACAI